MGALSAKLDGAVPQKRNIITDTKRLWSNGVVPISFSDSVDGYTRERIFASMKEVEASTYSAGKPCVTFVIRDGQPDYVEFTTISGNSGDSVPGKIGGKQTIHLYDNINKADIMQLLAYTLGFYNEFRRPDRDSFVNIHFDNIAPENQGFFSLTNDTTNFNYPFDFNSITFFHPYAYALDPSKPTMTAKYESQTFPWKLSLSQYDITNIQREYQCGIDTNNRVNLATGLLTYCNFEFDLCQWTQDTTDDFDFVRMKGAGDSDATGPVADYSNGIGYYLLAEASGNHNQDARLMSPVLDAGTYCIRMYYYLYGADVHTVKLIRRMSGVDTVLEELSGNQGALWHSFYNDYTATAPFQFVLEAVIGGSDLGDMAFDDVYILKGKCVV